MNELLAIIRNSTDIEKATEVAMQIIVDYLKQLESSEVQASACLQEHD